MKPPKHNCVDVAAEKPVNTMISSTYVPRDEALEGTRRTDILMGILKGVLHNIPPVMATLYNENGAFRDIAYLTGLYRNVQQAEMTMNKRGLLKFLDIRGPIEDIFKFETPKNMSCECQVNQILISNKYCVPFLNH